MKTFATLALLALLTNFGWSAAHHIEPEELGGLLEARAEGIDRAIYLPLRKTDVRIQMSGSVVETQVTQEFRNRTEHALEAVYLFPLPSDATITDMELRVGERTIRSKVMERKDAQRTYKIAKSAGIKTALLEQERPNMFTTSVANFLPGETVRVRFNYVHTAQFSEAGYGLTFPTVVGERFVPASGEVADAERIWAPVFKPTVTMDYSAGIELHINGIPVEEVISNTHPIRFEKKAGDGGGFRVTLKDKLTRPDRDFDIEIKVKKGALAKLSVVAEKAEEKGLSQHALINVFPPIEVKEPVRRNPRDVIFVIDTSGSMAGDPMFQAQAGLRKCLTMLAEEDAFTIVRFSNSYSLFAPELRQATEENLTSARAYVVGLQAGGGTYMQPALRHGLRLKGRAEATRLVVFLTDGAVGNESTLVKMLDTELRGARLFTIGIGSAPNEFLMNKMAEAGRGQSRFIHTDADIAGEISDLFETISAPVLTGVELKWKDAEGRLVDRVTHYPHPCPDVFHDRPLEVVAALPDGFAGGTLEMTGQIGGEVVAFHQEINLEAAESRAGVSKLFGRARIDDLMQQHRLAETAAGREKLQATVTKLGLDYQLVTNFTSRIVVDDRGSRIPSARLRREVVPTHQPRGVAPAAGPARPAGGGRIAFPKPMFIGTPVATRLPNLERPGRPRLYLKAPKDAILLSADKPVTSSDPLPIIGDLPMITDGDKDGADGSYIELGPDLQWVQIDLGKAHELFGIVLWHFHKNARAYLDVIVQVSDDPTFKTGVTTVYNNDHDASAGLGLGKGKDNAWVETNHGRIIDIAGQSARYVRLYSRGNTANQMNHYVEVEVYGKP